METCCGGITSWIAVAISLCSVAVTLFLGTNCFESWRKSRERKDLLSKAEKQADEIIKARGSDPIDVLRERAREVYNFEVPFYVFEKDEMEDIEIACIVFYLLFGEPVKHKPCEDKIFRIYHFHDGHLEDEDRAIFKTAADLLSVRGHWRSFNYLFGFENDDKTVLPLLEIAYSPDKTTSINRSDEDETVRIIELMLDPETANARKVALHDRNNP